MNYKVVDDLSGVWCEYGEMELRYENYDAALHILRVRHTNTQPFTRTESEGLTACF